MNTKRILAALLSAALTLSLLVLPAGAAGSFSDVTDPTTALNADILRLMGIVNGVGNGRFDPDGTLTRAQFCTMAVGLLQKRSEAARYATRTIFSDVGSTHWARSYINFAACYDVGGGSSEEGSSAGTPLVSGVGDGRFLPNNEITLAEAATILLRALGYSGQEAGAVWPQGYMDLAGSIGLLNGLSGGALAPISRAQAAQLFVNALKCKKADGQIYYKTLGTLADETNKTIILAVNVTTDDGRSAGAIRTSSSKDQTEAFLPVQGDGNVPALQGKRGDLVLNERGDQIVAFIPDDSTAITITLSGDAQAAYVKASGGRQYTIASDTPVFTSAGGSSKPWSDAHSTLVSGTQITMYSDKGKISAVYATGSTTTTDSDAVVVLGNATAATFHQLTGGASDFKIVKGRQTIGLSDIKDYDVVTYDPLTNTLMVSDLRLSCVYQDAEPNAKTPTKIYATKDQSFDVLSSAWTTTGDFKIGETVTLLLTADGNVAGMAPTNKVRSNAIGYAEGKEVKMFLPDGRSIPLKGESSVEDQLVSISYGKDRINTSRLSTRTAPGPFQVNGMTLGSYTVTAGVRVYEQVRGGAMVEVDRSSLTMGSVPAGQIAAYHLNSSNMVDYIVLNDVTGDAYQYGMMVFENENYTVEEKKKDENGNIMYNPKLDDKGNEEKDSNGKPIPDYDKPIMVSVPKTRQVWKLVQGSKELKFVNSVSYSGKSGDMVGVVPGTPKGEGDGKTMLSLIKLTEIKNVKPSDFFDSQGAPHVTVNGRTYRVSDKVECCHSNGGNRATDVTWFEQKTGPDRLSAARAWSDDLTIYVDPVGQQVRVVKAN